MFLVYTLLLRVNIGMIEKPYMYLKKRKIFFEKLLSCAKI